MITLKLGSKGEDVKTLQKKLDCNVDGIFGNITEEAVKDFQRKNNLTVDGVVGDKTWAALGLKKKETTRPINKIFLHCSATKEGKDYTVDDIRSWHKARGFSDVGYHYVIYRDGTVKEGRPINQIPAAQSGHNVGSIAICYIGGLAEDGKTPKDTRTSEQKESMYKLLKDLMEKYNLKQTDIHGHYEVSDKYCPCFKIPIFLNDYNQWVKKEK